MSNNAATTKTEVDEALTSENIDVIQSENSKTADNISVAWSPGGVKVKKTGSKRSVGSAKRPKPVVRLDVSEQQVTETEKPLLQVEAWIASFVWAERMGK